MDGTPTTTDGASPATDGGRWLPVAAAAKAAGISQRSIRRRVQEGTAHARLVGRLTHVYVRRDGRTDVPPPSVDVTLPTSGTPVPPTDALSPASDGTATAMDGALAALLREQINGRLRAEQAAAMWQERARNLEVENGRLHELLALPAHEEKPGPRRRWWQWWRP